MTTWLVCSTDEVMGLRSISFRVASMAVIDSVIWVPVASISAFSSSLSVVMLVVMVVWLIPIWLTTRSTFSFTAFTSVRISAEALSDSCSARALAPAPAAPPSARPAMADVRCECVSLVSERRSRTMFECSSIPDFDSWTSLFISVRLDRISSCEELSLIVLRSAV